MTTLKTLFRTMPSSGLGSGVCQRQQERLPAVSHWCEKLSREEVSLPKHSKNHPPGLIEYSSLEYTELRIILARMLWNFGMQIAKENLDWMSKQKISNPWEKGPLYVYLTLVK